MRHWDADISAEERGSGHGKTHLQVLYQIIEHAQAFWIFAVLNVHQRTNLCGLHTCAILVSDQRCHTEQNPVSLPQRRCDRFQRESRVPVFLQYSFSANWYHPPFVYPDDGDQVCDTDSFQRITHFVISLDSTILLSSLTISGPIHTEKWG